MTPLRERGSLYSKSWNTREVSSPPVAVLPSPYHRDGLQQGNLVALKRPCPPGLGPVLARCL